MATCPDQLTLRSFAIGDLPSGQFDDLADHVLQCRACDSALDALEQHADVLVAQLRNITGSSSATRNGSAVEIAFDSGRHYARLLKDGPCRLGRFELLDEIGVGSFGYVFRARDTELDRIVALKIQRAGSVANDAEARRFLHEARSVASLTHPGIVALYDTGQTDDGVCYLVTEFIDGQTLEQRLQQDRFDHQATAELVAQLADALEYAHQHGIVHRDVKPSNVLIDEHQRPHIADFGLAKRDNGEASMTSDGRVLGTPAYMAPEQARGDSQQVGPPTDIYSLGVILYEMLTGERPFHGTKRLLLLQVLEDEPRPPRLLEERIPRDLETICLKAMSKAPARRYATASQLAHDLRRYLRGDPIAARPVGTSERLWRWCRKYPLAASLFVAISLGSLAGFLYLTQLSAYFVQATALDSARMEADMLEDVQAYYSDLLANLDTKQVKVRITHEYAICRDAMPLPATFLIDAGQRISANESGMQVRVYSQYPFRANGGPKSQFERVALQECAKRRIGRSVDATDDVEYYEFITADDRRYLNYARGQMMKDSCVKCHNNHEKSPKKDWKEGDLVGILALTRPLDRDIDRTRAGLQGAFILMGAIAIVLVASGLAFAVRTRYSVP